VALQGFFGLIDRLLGRLLHFASRLVHLSFATKLVVVGDCPGGLLNAAFHFFRFP
jgi:hypothetical protein